MYPFVHPNVTSSVITLNILFTIYYNRAFAYVTDPVAQI